MLPADWRKPQDRSAVTSVIYTNMSSITFGRPRITWPAFRPTSMPQLVIAWTLMWPFVFFAARGIFSFQDSSDGSDMSGLVPTRHLGVFGYIVLPGIAYLIVMYLVTLNFRRIISIALQMKMLTLLGLLTVCSALWSQNPARSLYNGVFYLTGTLFAYYLVTRFDPKDIMGLVMMTGTLACLGGLVMVVLFPQFGVDTVHTRTAGAWKGIFFDRTGAAKTLVYLLSPALVFGYRRLGPRRMAYILLLGIFIVKAKAVTALVVGVLYTTVMLSLYLVRWVERRTAVLAAMTVIPTLIIIICAGLPFLPDVLSAMGRDPTLTGRTVVWSVLMPSVFKQPLLGYGFYAFWQGLTGESANAINAVHWFFGYAHNGMLEIVLQLGLVGLVVFLITLAQAIKDAWFCIRHGRSIGVEWYVGIIILVVLYNVDEATVLLPNDLLSIMYVIACCGLSITSRQIKAAALNATSHEHLLSN